MELSGKVALVTGSARRLGAAIARGLARAGTSVAIHHSKSPQAAETVARELGQLGAHVEIFQADLTDSRQIFDLFSDIDKTFGRLDILVNSAAIFERKPVLEITPEIWDRTLNLNLRAPFFCSQSAARLMQRAGGGLIINIADIGSFQPWPAYAHHCTAKAGIVMLTRVLARALAPDVRVNAIAPGPVLPPDDLTDEQRRQLAGMTVLGRLGDPEDILKAVLFLLESDYVTGETIVVDGGKLLAS
jgi:pteridine reductase